MAAASLDNVTRPRPGDFELNRERIGHLDYALREVPRVNFGIVVNPERQDPVKGLDNKSVQLIIGSQPLDAALVSKEADGPKIMDISTFLAVLLECQELLSEAHPLFRSIEDKWMEYGVIVRPANKAEQRAYHVALIILNQERPPTEVQKKIFRDKLQQLLKKTRAVEETLQDLAEKKKGIEINRILKNIADYPQEPSHYVTLGSTLAQGQKVPMPSGKEWGKKELYIEAIRLNPKYATAYIKLAKNLRAGEVADLSIGKKDRRELLRRAIELEPTKCEAYHELANTLRLKEETPVPGFAILMNQIDLNKEALKHNPKFAPPYYSLAILLPQYGMKSLTLHDGKSLDVKSLLKEFEKLQRAQNQPQEVSEPDVSDELKTNDLLFLLKRYQELNKKSEISLTLDKIYEVLAENNHTLTKTEKKAYVLTQRILASQEKEYASFKNKLMKLLLQAVPLHEEEMKGEKRGGQVVKAPHQQLSPDQKWLLESISSNQMDTEAYYNLANSLCTDETVDFQDGRKMDRLMIYREIIRYCPHEAKAFVLLADELAPYEQVRLPQSDGRTLTKIELYVEAIKLQSGLSAAYYGLALCLRPEDSIVLANGNRMDQYQLLLRAILHNPQFASAYYMLSTLVKQFDTVVLLDGVTKLDKQGLLLRALKYDTRFSRAFSDLTHILVYEPINLPDGRMMDKKKLNLEALRLDPFNVDAYSNLIYMGFEKDLIELPDGRVYYKGAEAIAKII